MLRDERVTLRASERDDLPLIRDYNNALAVELAGRGNPPMPQSLARVQAEFDANAAKGGRDGAAFGIEVGRPLIGSCILFDTTVRIIPRATYMPLLASAEARIGDPDDRATVALALATGAGIWTLDRDFFGIGLPVWNTDVLIRHVAIE